MGKLPNCETKGSLWTYQETNGSNTTIFGTDNIFKLNNNNSLTSFIGHGVDYNPNNNSRNNYAVIDLKGNFKYGETLISGGFRLREKFGDDTNCTQIRIQPFNYNKQVAKDLNLYATSYGVVKINWKNNTVEPVLGAFVGASYNINKVKISAELQYDKSIKLNKNLYSVNFGVNLPLMH